MDCPSIPVMDGIEFRMQFFDKFRKKRIPFTCQIEVTARCNVRCSHCYISDINSKGELTFPEIQRIIDEVVDAGCLWFVLTGGEPLLRPDFLDIYTYAKKKGLFVVVFTNGTLVNERILDCFIDLPPYAVEISLYGATEETYERVVGVRGSYRRCMDGIELLLKHHMPLSLKTVSVADNQHEIQAIRRFAEKLGVAFRYDPLINPRIDGGMGPCNTRMSPQEIVAQDMTDSKRFETLRKMYEWSLKWQRSDLLFDCGAGNKAFNVDAYGQLQLCGLARKFSYDLRNGSFHDAWHNFLPKVLSMKREKSSRCDGCKLFVLCGMCPSWSELENGGDEGPVDFICQVAHLRANALDAHPKEATEESRVLTLQS